jgi:hypothetical protein
LPGYFRRKRLSLRYGVNPWRPDADGVVVIPRLDAEKVLEDVLEFQQNDRRKLQAAIDGTADRRWVMKQLEAKKCEIVDGVFQ